MKLRNTQLLWLL